MQHKMIMFNTVSFMCNENISYPASLMQCTVKNYVFFT